MHRYFIFILTLVLFASCSQESIKTIEVSGKLAACSETAENKCLKVKLEGEQEWFLIEAIKGFDHKNGVNHTIKVKETIVDDTSTYELIEKISQKPTPLELEDGSWDVTSILDNNDFADSERVPFMTFTPSESRVHGSTSCNKFFGNLFYDHANFKVENIGMTKMLCPDNTVENSFIRALENAVSYEINDNVLHLLSEDHKILIKASFNMLKQ